MNPTVECILKRGSIRKFKEIKPSEEQIDTLVKAALASPSANNSQPWHFTIATDVNAMHELENELVDICLKSGDEAAIKRLLERNKKILYDVPLIIFVSSKPDGHFNMLDCGIAIENIAIAAQSLGLASIILGGPRAAFDGNNKAYFENLFKFPDGYHFTCAIGVGYPDTEKQQHEHDYSKVTYMKNH